jgi:STAS-like domain of unknown function (DUF4325)
MSPITIVLEAGPTGFTDDKDEAKRIREKTILPTLESNQQIILDFCKVRSSTQSFVHALLGEALQRFRESALDRIQFKGCTPLMKGLVQLVVDYSLGGFRSDQANVKGEANDRKIEKATRKPKQGAKGKRYYETRKQNKKSAQ